MPGLDKGHRRKAPSVPCLRASRLYGRRREHEIFLIIVFLLAAGLSFLRALPSEFFNLEDFLDYSETDGQGLQILTLFSENSIFQVMSEIKRFGVSLESDLLTAFDSLIEKIGYKSRSDAIRNLIRNRLVSDEWEKADEEIVGILGLVFNHEVRELTERLTFIQHQYTKMIISSSHIHLDKHNCLEVIIMKGKCSLVRKVADELISTRSVKHGDLITTTTGKKIG